MIECDKIIVTCRQAAGQTSVTLTRRELCKEKEEREHQRGEVRAALRCRHAALTATRLQVRRPQPFLLPSYRQLHLRLQRDRMIQVMRLANRFLLFHARLGVLPVQEGEKMKSLHVVLEIFFSENAIRLGIPEDCLSSQRKRLPLTSLLAQQLSPLSLSDDKQEGARPSIETQW